MSLEIINAKSQPSSVLPPYRNRTENSTTYIRSAETLAKQTLFCEGYIHKGTLTGAAKYAGISVSNHFRWLDVDPDYPKRFEVAKLTAQELLVEEGRRRALEGVEEPTGWYRGEPGGFVKRYSDSLLIFLIKGAFPDIYKDRHEHTGRNGGPIEVQSTVTIEQFPVWLKQAIVVCSTGIAIDPEVEKILQAHFEAKFLEAEKVVGNGTTGGRGEAGRLEAYQDDTESTHSDTTVGHGDTVVSRLIESATEESGREPAEVRESVEPITGLDPSPNASPGYRLNERKQKQDRQEGQKQEEKLANHFSLSLDDI